MPKLALSYCSLIYIFLFSTILSLFFFFFRGGGVVFGLFISFTFWPQYFTFYFIHLFSTLYFVFHFIYFLTSAIIHYLSLVFRILGACHYPMVAPHFFYILAPVILCLSFCTFWTVPFNFFTTCCCMFGLFWPLIVSFPCSISLLCLHILPDLFI